MICGYDKWERMFLMRYSDKEPAADWRKSAIRFNSDKHCRLNDIRRKSHDAFLCKGWRNNAP